MDILKRIRCLQEERHWSLYRLSLEAGLTQSTLNNMFKRKTDPSIKTLEALCDAFGISLSDFFSEGDNNISISGEEKRLIDDVRSLPPKERKDVMALIEALSK